MNLETFLSILRQNKALCDEYFFEELLDLIDDEEQDVRDIAITHFKNMSYFSPAKFRERGLDSLRMLLEKDDEYSRFIMDNIVTVLDNIKDVLFVEDPDAPVVETQTFLVDQIKAYVRAPFSPLDEETMKISKPESICKNFPGIAILFGKELFSQYLLETYFQLLSSSELRLRQIMAASFHEVIKIYDYGVDAIGKGFDLAFQKLLADEDQLVSILMIKNLDTVLGVFLNEEEEGEDEEVKREPPIRPFQISKILPHILKIEEKLRNDW